MGLRCPVCGQIPFMVLGGTRAVCDRVGCPVQTWNPQQTRVWFFGNASEATRAAVRARGG